MTGGKPEYFRGSLLREGSSPGIGDTKWGRLQPNAVKFL